jgi:hypothetical protein
VAPPCKIPAQAVPWFGARRREAHPYHDVPAWTNPGRPSRSDRARGLPSLQTCRPFRGEPHCPAVLASQLAEHRSNVCVKGGKGAQMPDESPSHSLDPAGRSKSPKRPSPRTLRGLDGLNFFLADVQTGVGPFLAIYLAGYRWNEERVGLALTVGGIAGILAQTPAGALVDSLRSKRALVAVAVAALAAGALLIAICPSFWPVMGAQVIIGGTSSVFIPAICAMSLGIVGRSAFDARQGRNQTFNSAGNMMAAVSMGLLG